MYADFCVLLVNYYIFVIFTQVPDDSDGDRMKAGSYSDFLSSYVLWVDSCFIV
jgi:hypothetical protein